MRCKILTVAAAILVLLATGCSTVEKVVYRPDINQGNYLSPTDITKIHTGMTKQQVAYVLGTPMLQDPFSSSSWFYVFRQQPGHEDITQQTLTLTFDNRDTLTSISNKPALNK